MENNPLLALMGALLISVPAALLTTTPPTPGAGAAPEPILNTIQLVVIVTGAIGGVIGIFVQWQKHRSEKVNSERVATDRLVAQNARLLEDLEKLTEAEHRWRIAKSVMLDSPAGQAILQEVNRVYSATHPPLSPPS